MTVNLFAQGLNAMSFNVAGPLMVPGIESGQIVARPFGQAPNAFHAFLADRTDVSEAWGRPVKEYALELDGNRDMFRITGKDYAPRGLARYTNMSAAFYAADQKRGRILEAGLTYNGPGFVLDQTAMGVFSRDAGAKLLRGGFATRIIIEPEFFSYAATMERQDNEYSLSPLTNIASFVDFLPFDSISLVTDKYIRDFHFENTGHDLSEEIERLTAGAGRTLRNAYYKKQYSLTTGLHREKRLPMYSVRILEGEQPGVEDDDGYLYERPLIFAGSWQHRFVPMLSIDQYSGLQKPRELSPSMARLIKGAMTLVGEDARFVAEQSAMPI
ncbi:MAG: hypothetical protein HY540_00285 [Deltaproteobacteria bacterium]|nr:hypothetical protein [Deltaproteobacteria bacterium]